MTIEGQDVGSDEPLECDGYGADTRRDRWHLGAVRSRAGGRCAGLGERRRARLSPARRTLGLRRRLHRHQHRVDLGTASQPGARRVDRRSSQRRRHAQGQAAEVDAQAPAAWLTGPDLEFYRDIAGLHRHACLTHPRQPLLWLQGEYGLTPEEADRYVRKARHLGFLGRSIPGKPGELVEPAPAKRRTT